MDWEELGESVTEYVSEFLWGTSPREVMRKASLEIRTSVRKLERDKALAKQKEGKLLSDLKVMAPKAHSASDLKQLALSICRTRKGITQICNLQYTLEGLQQQLLQSETTTTINSVMLATTQALSMVANLNDPRAMSSNMQQFQMQKMKLESTQEMLDDVQEGDEEEDATEMISLLQEEIGFQLAFDLPSAKRATDTRAADKQRNVQAAEEDPELLTLMARLDVLKKT